MLTNVICNGVKVLLYKRYVDDIIIVLEALDSRLKYVKDSEEKLQIGEEASNETPDVHTLKILKQVGDDIHSCIQLEYECPSMHEDKKLPVLDLKMWILTLDGDKVRLLHEFYQKAVASRMVVHSRSSLP